MNTSASPEASPYRHLDAAWQCFDEGRLDDAIDLAHLSLQDSPTTDADSSAALAWFLLCKGSNKDAEALITKALERHPAHPPLHWYLGVLHQRAHRLEAAAEALTKAVALAPQLDEAATTLAWVLVDLGRLEEAALYARQALALRQRSERFEQLGWILLRLEAFDEAIAQFNAALSMEPQRTQVRLHLVAALQRMGRNNDALQILADGLTFAPDDGDLLQAQAQVLIDARRTQESRAICHRLLRLPHHAAQGWYLLARVQVQRKRKASAVRALTRALNLANSQQPDLWQAIAWLALEIAELRLAKPAVQKVLALVPHDPNAAILAALVCEASGDLSVAAEHAERAVANASQSARAWRALAQVRARQDRLPEAEQALQTALQLGPDDRSDTFLQLGWVKFTQSQYEAALEAFRAAVQAQETNAAAWYGLAQAYRATAQYLDALRAIRQTLRLREDWNDRTLRGQIIHEQVYHFLRRKWSNLHGTPQAPSSIPATPCDTASASTPSYDYVVCSLSTKSHLPLMNTLAQSVRKHFTGRIYLLVVDSDDASLIPADTTLVRLQDVIAPTVWQELQGRYNILELCCVLKSYLMRFVAKMVDSPILYLDADTYLLSPLAPLLPPSPDFSVLLTPHLTTPLPGDSHAEEIGMLSVGVYNGGVVGVGRAQDGIRFLDWWADRVTRYAYDSREQGVFTDQKWLDLVPCFFQNVHVSRASGINVGHWRVCSEQDFEDDATGQLMFRGQTVTHMHMSGFKTQRPDLLAQHILPPVSQDSPLGKFLQRYALEVIQNTR